MNSNITEHAVLCNGYPAAARLSFVIMQQPGVGGYAALEIFFHGCPVPENLPILSGELLSRARVHSRLPPEPGAPARQNPQSSWFGSPIRVSAPDRLPNPWSHCGAMAPRIFCCFSKPQSNSSQVLRLRPLWRHEESFSRLSHGQNRHVFLRWKPQLRSAVGMLCNYIPDHVPRVNQFHTVRSVLGQFQRIPGAAAQIIIDQKRLLATAAHKSELRRKICRLRFAHAGEAVHNLFRASLGMARCSDSHESSLGGPFLPRKRL